MPMIRTAEEFLREPHYLEALQDLPLIEIEKIADTVHHGGIVAVVAGTPDRIATAAEAAPSGDVKWTR